MIPVYLSLGSNLGDRETNLTQALSHLEASLGVPCAACSSFLETEPWGYASSHAFVNACARFDLPWEETEDSALRLLDICKEIESAMGRIQRLPGEGYRDRIIDIDILLFGDLRMHTSRLTIPHPLMRKRDFVMIPLGEILKKKRKFAD